MKFVIKRYKEGEDYTIGKFTLYGGSGLELFKGYTLEPSGSDSIIANQDKRVPEGVYRATFKHSPRFKKSLPVIFNEAVSEDRRILIHSGNSGKDTQGCILVGDSVSEGWVNNSNKTLKSLFEFLGYKDFIVEIYNG